MKTITVTVLVVLFVLGTGNCQSKTNEFSISYGFYSTNGALIDETMDDVITIISLGTVVAQAQNIKETGPILISYRNIAKPWFRVGVIAGYTNVEYDWVESSLYSSGTSSRKVERSSYTFATEADFRYLRRENFTMYSLIGFGYTVVDDRSEPTETGEEWENHFDMHISFVGFRYGKDLGGFIELGAGYKGLVNFGMNYMF